MTRRARAVIDTAAVIAMSLTFAACASTRMNVAKVSALCDKENPKNPCGGNEPGIRYALPQPFLLVTPSASGDGSFSVEVIYLPDERRTYAIDASTRRGKFTLDVDIKDGLLSKIAWKRSDADVVAENVRASGEMAKSRLQAIQEQEKEDKKEREADRKEAEKTVETLQAESGKASLEVSLHQEEVDDIKRFHDKKKADNKPVTDEDLARLRAAELELAKAKLRSAQADRLLREGRRKAVALGALANAPAGTVPPATSEEMPKEFFKSPVLYAIREDDKGLRLELARWGPGATDPWQAALETRTAPDLTPGPPPPRLKGSAPVIPRNTANLTVTAELTQPIVDVDRKQQVLTGPDGVAILPAPLVIEKDGDTKLKITVTSGLKEGTHAISVPVMDTQKITTQLTIPLLVK